MIIDFLKKYQGRPDVSVRLLWKYVLLICFNIENKFTAGSASSFSVTLTIPEGFRPDKMVVHSPLYEDATVIVGPITLSCSRLGGDLISFMRSDSVGLVPATPVYACRRTFSKPPDIQGTYTFLCSQRGIGLTTLNGNLAFKITFIKNRIQSDRDKAYEIKSIK